MKKQKENSLENITWSEMGKQNVQAKGLLRRKCCLCDDKGHWDGVPSLSRTVFGFNDPRCCETSPTVYCPYPRRLESLTICRFLHLHLHVPALGKVRFWPLAVSAYVDSYTTSFFSDITPSRALLLKRTEQPQHRGMEFPLLWLGLISFIHGSFIQRLQVFMLCPLSPID